MKRQGNLKEQILDLDNMALAAHKAFRGKRGKNEVRKFFSNFNDNITRLRDDIATGANIVGNYRYFTIYDPKERVICAASLEERILHHAIMNICHSRFDKALVYDTYATRPGKGVYAALDKARIAMKGYSFYAKLDVRKYYDSIDHNVLKNALRRLFKDRWLLELLDRIIDSYSVVPGKGVPIGNLTSQYFANLYLSGLDHFMKEVQKVPVFIRYMDDVLLLHNDRESLKAAVEAYRNYSFTNLKLEIKQPLMGKSSAGVRFLGYRVMPGYMLLCGNSKRRFRTKLTEYAKMYSVGEIDDAEYGARLTPLLAFTRHASAKCFRKSCIGI